MTQVYDAIGVDYANLRRPEPRWAAQIEAAPAGAQSIVNVGAGSGSYEPANGSVVALEPSFVMIDQRPPGAAPVVAGIAEALPFPEDSFDAALAVLTVHHWRDPDAGFAELRRVASRQVVMTWDREAVVDFWLVREYLPEIAEREADVVTMRETCAGLDTAHVEPMPVSWDCVDGCIAAYWRRPHAYLDARVRAAISGFALLEPAVVERGIAALAADHDNGAWQSKHADLLDLDELDAGYRLVTAGGTG